MLSTFSLVVWLFLVSSKRAVTLSEEMLLMSLIPCHQPICSLFSITGSQEK